MLPGSVAGKPGQPSGTHPRACYVLASVNVVTEKMASFIVKNGTLFFITVEVKSLKMHMLEIGIFFYVGFWYMIFVHCSN